MGFLVLLNGHRGEEDLALLADDLDLEIDEVVPAVEYAEVLQLVRVSDGRVALTDLGRKFLAGSIRERKVMLREQLRKTTLFKALMRALENAPDHRLSEEEVDRLIAFTTAPAEEYVQNIINWGRYAELFRYDSDERVLLPTRARAGARGGSPPRSPPPSTPTKSSSAIPPISSPTSSRAPVEKIVSAAEICS